MFAHLRIILILCLLGLAPSLPNFNFAYAQQVHAEILEDEENESSAIAFESMLETQFEQVPDAVHKAVNNMLVGHTDQDVSYAKISDGKYVDHYIVSVTKKNDDGTREHLQSFIVSSEGSLKKIKNPTEHPTISTFVAKKYHFVEKLAHHVSSLDDSAPHAKGSSLTIRQRYNTELTAMSVEISDIGLENITEAEAREFYTKRRELGKELKYESPFYERWCIYYRNWDKYGDRFGPTYDSFAAKGLTPAQIAVKAATTGGKNLGLNSNNNEPIITRLTKEVNKPTKSQEAQRASSDVKEHSAVLTSRDNPASSAQIEQPAQQKPQQSRNKNSTKFFSKKFYKNKDRITPDRSRVGKSSKEGDENSGTIMPEGELVLQ